MSATPLTIAPSAPQPHGSQPLSAPEGYLLRYAEGTRVGPQALNLALRELVLRDALILVAVHTPLVFGLGRRRRWMLTRGRAVAEVVSPALEPILELEASLPRRRLPRVSGVGEVEGILADDFVKAFERRFGGPRGYVERHLVPLLESRGLLTRRGRAKGGTRYRYTAAGRLADEEFDRQMQVVKRSGRRISGNGPHDLLTALLVADYANPTMRLLDMAGFDSVRAAFSSLEMTAAWGFGGDGGGCGGDGGGC
jgi:hypothetical protein